MELQKRIGIVMGKVYREINQEQLIGILEQAYSHGFSAYVFTLIEGNNDEKTTQGEINLFEMINFDLVDGFIFLPYTFSAREYWLYAEDFLRKHCRKPVISVESCQNHFPNVWYDDRAEFAAMVRHVIEVHGCQKIHCLTGPYMEAVSMNRLYGYQDAMHDAGLSFTDEDITYGDFWKYSAQQLAEEFVYGIRPKPDAVVCANDIMATSLCDALKSLGISVPDDVIVTGYDGTLDAKLHSPTITTYSTSWKQLGRKAMCALYESITGNTMEFCALDNGTVFCRESCGCNSDSTLHQHLPFDYQRLEDNYTDSNLSAQLLTSDSLSTFVQKSYHLTYVFLKLEQCGFESYNIFLCEDWDKTDMDGFTRNYRTSGFSDQMLWIDFEGCRHSFPVSNMIPSELQSDKPSVTFFTSIHFQERCFGYAALTLTGIADGFNHHYIRFCREVNNGLEFLCIQNELKGLAYRRYLSQTRDDLTGLLNRNSFPQQWSEIQKIAQTYHTLPFLLGFSIHGLHQIKENYGTVEKDKLLLAFADILQNCCQHHEKCFRAREGEFLIIGSYQADKPYYDSLTQKIQFQFEQHCRSVNYPFRLRLHHAAIPDCSNLPDGENALQTLTEILQDTLSNHHTFSEQMHYEDLVSLRGEIYQNPELEWSVTLCCQKLSISASYFQRIYRNAFGVSCAQDIQKSKLDYAKKLLLNTTDTLQTISRKCGYDYSHFMRTFKKEVGITPTEYRKGKTE